MPFHTPGRALVSTNVRPEGVSGGPTDTRTDTAAPASVPSMGRMRRDTC